MKNRIRELREVRGWSQTKLGETIGTSQAQIDRLEKNERRLSDFWMDKIAKAFHIEPRELISVNKKKMIPIVGSVGAGGQIFPIDDMPLIRVSSESEQVYMNCDFVEAPPENGHEEAVALRVTGDSMEPFIEDGSVVYYDGRRVDGINEYINKLCVVQLANGQALLKKLKRGTKDGFHTLTSYNAKDIEDVEIVWCAKVIFIKPV